MNPINVSNSSVVNIITGSQNASIATSEDKVGQLKVIFDLFEYEHEIISGYPHIPSYGIEVINHLPHSVRVTEHHLEGLTNGEWGPIRWASFDDRSEEVTWEEGGKQYARYDRSLPRVLERNERKLWRVSSLNGFQGKVRGVIIADRQRHESEPFEIKELIQAERLLHISI